MNIGIIDADVIGKKKHRFPNLACMKISSYHKSQGHNVKLLTSYDDIENYDKVFLSKVFTDTPIPEGITDLSWVEYGGTGFFYDKATPLPYEIEHSMPDYHLYDEWVNEKLIEGVNREDYETEEEYEEDKAATIKKRRKEFAYYLDYSIGFATRGCIRGCSFCVNKNYKQCLKHSPISEFLDESRPYICLLDDNVLSCKDWKEIFEELNATGKRFQFKQGMDERLLTDEKCEVIFNSKWIGHYIFAFDNIKDYRLIEKKLQMIRKYTNAPTKFYLFCGYNHIENGVYSEEFWVNDIVDLFRRIELLMKYGALPYMMRYADYKQSRWASLYNTIAAWCNQPNFFTKFSFRGYCEYGKKLGRNGLLKFLEEFEAEYPEVAKEWFDKKCDEVRIKDICYE